MLTPRDLFKVITDSSTELISSTDENRITVVNYFQEICNGLINSRSEDFMAFVYSNLNIMDSLVDNAKYDGVRKVLSAVLNLYESVNNLNSFRFLKHRFGLYRKALKKLLETEDLELAEQLGRIFIDLVKDKSKIVDSHYFIDKIMLEGQNHVDLIDKAVRLKSIGLCELEAILVEMVVPPKEEKNFLEDNSLEDLAKQFSKIYIYWQIGLLGLPDTQIWISLLESPEFELIF